MRGGEVRHLVLRVITMMLIGVVIGPLVGMYITEYWAGGGDSLATKQSGFEGFSWGLWIGPVVGLAVGLILWGNRRGD